MILNIILGISILANIYLGWLHFKGKDANKNGLDDRLEIKVQHLAKEIKDVKDIFKK